jgi:hypothetical protein
VDVPADFLEVDREDDVLPVGVSDVALCVKEVLGEAALELGGA